ncbi:hypothetical protein PR048_024254 [Dryococelus australis]|uniref:Uncharacterized protein n=1 Tax=Dryococelus australis TaxID=614101 RepID=A0ABQ9GN29_9NEOP|nr:hypothetical protein PR048_024254 [Dryococelus australis]
MQFIQAATCEPTCTVSNYRNVFTLSCRYGGRSPCCRVCISAGRWLAVVRQNPRSMPHKGHGGRTISTLASHQGEPGSIPGRVTGFSQVGIVQDDAVGLLVFSRISISPPLHSGAAPYSLLSPSSAHKTSLLRAAQISSLTSSEVTTKGISIIVHAMECQTTKGITITVHAMECQEHQRHYHNSPCHGVSRPPKASP